MDKFLSTALQRWHECPTTTKFAKGCGQRSTRESDQGFEQNISSNPCLATKLAKGCGRRSTKESDRGFQQKFCSKPLSGRVKDQTLVHTVQIGVFAWHRTRDVRPVARPLNREAAGGADAWIPETMNLGRSCPGCW